MAWTRVLPEEKIRVVIARNLGISLNNDYGILERVGGDCAGAVSLYPETGEPKLDPGTYRRLSLDELNTINQRTPPCAVISASQLSLLQNSKNCHSRSVSDRESGCNCLKNHIPDKGVRG